jgi:hypothetical protein
MNIEFDKVGIAYRSGYEVGRLRTAICLSTSFLFSRRLTPDDALLLAAAHMWQLPIKALSKP